MTLALADKPCIARRARIESTQLTVERSQILFRNVDPNLVRISVTVSNLGRVASEPTKMILQAAPLGAFVPWQPLTAIDVPSVQPLANAEVITEVPLPQTRAVGEFSNVPPRKLLTALFSDDEPEDNRPGRWRFLTGLPRGRRVERSDTDLSSSLPSDPFDLLLRDNAHWAGNINVLMGGTAVERHMAQALRIYPGRTNLAMFCVGSNMTDAYKFELAGSAASWDAALLNMTNAMTLVSFGSRSQLISGSEWIKTDGMQLVMLAVRPPESCTQGTVEVHVHQQSTGKEAIVEFSLDASAAGAGCYSV